MIKNIKKLELGITQASREQDKEWFFNLFQDGHWNITNNAGKDCYFINLENVDFRCDFLMHAIQNKELSRSYNFERC